MDVVDGRLRDRVERGVPLVRVLPLERCDGGDDLLFALCLS